MGKRILILHWLLALLVCLYSHWTPVAVFLLGWITGLLYTGWHVTHTYRLVRKTRRVHKRSAMHQE